MRRVSFLWPRMLALGTASAARAQGLALGPYAQVPDRPDGGSTVGGLFGGEGGYSANSFDFFFEGGNMLNTKCVGDGCRRRDDCGVPRQAIPYVRSEPADQLLRPRLLVQAADVRKIAAVWGHWPGQRRRHARDDLFVNGSRHHGPTPGHGRHARRRLQGRSGDFFFMLGGGARIGLTGELFADVSYRYGHVSISSPAA